MSIAYSKHKNLLDCSFNLNFFLPYNLITILINIVKRIKLRFSELKSISHTLLLHSIHQFFVQIVSPYFFSTFKLQVNLLSCYFNLFINVTFVFL
jgi:hypothetical protein